MQSVLWQGDCYCASREARACEARVASQLDASLRVRVQGASHCESKYLAHILLTRTDSQHAIWLADSRLQARNCWLAGSWLAPRRLAPRDSHNSQSLMADDVQHYFTGSTTSGYLFQYTEVVISLGQALKETTSSPSVLDLCKCLKALPLNTDK